MAKGKKWGLLIPAALAVPTLISEGLATHKGGKLLEESGASERQKRHYKDSMGQGFRSYLMPPAAAMLVAGAMAVAREL